MVLDLLTMTRLKSILFLKPVSLDDHWDQMNRNVVVTFCIISGTIVTLKQNLGSSIQCLPATNFDKEFVDEYCWTQGLYTLKEMYDKSWPDEIPYPGILPYRNLACNPYARYKNGTPIRCPDPKDIKPFTEVHHIWYQFVPFIFWIAGVCFYMPYTFYRHLGGIYDIKPVLESLNNPIESDADIQKIVNNGSRWLYIKLDPLMNHTQPYTQIIQKHTMFYTTIFVKVMYLTTCIVTFYCLNCMFQIGSFAWYGYDWVVALAEGKDHIVMDKLFPKMVACEVKMWGPTGITNEHLMCVLPQNIGNQYFFGMFWVVLILVCFSNIFSLFQTIFRFVFVSASYKRFIRLSLLKDAERYHLVYTHVGTTGRAVLLLCAQHSNPKIFEDLMEIVTSLLISNYHKRKRHRGGRRTGNTMV